MAGQLVGEAWVAIHARDGGISGETRRIAEDAGEQMSERLDKVLYEEAKRRTRGDKSIAARFLASDDPAVYKKVGERWGENLQQSIAKMIEQVPEGNRKIRTRMFRDLEAAMKRYNAWQLEQQEITNKKIQRQEFQHHRAMSRIMDEAIKLDKIWEQERAVSGVRRELEKISTQMNRKYDGDLLRVMAGQDWKVFVRNFRDLDHAAEGLSDTLIRLGRTDSSLLVGDVDRMTESFARFRDVQERLAQEKDFSPYAARLTREYEKARAALKNYADTAEETRTRVNRALDSRIALAQLTGDWTNLSNEMGKSRTISGHVRDRLAELSREGLIHRDVVRDINVQYFNWRRTTRGFAEVFDQFPERLGRMFGRGSRNNFLNFFGSVLKNFADLGLAVPRIAARIGGSIADIVQDFQALRSANVGVVTALTRSLAPALASLLPVLAAIGVGGAIVAKLVPGIAAAISSLTGILTAWVGVVVTGVLGALVPLVPLLVGVAGGLIAVAAAFVSAYQRISESVENGTELTGPLQDLKLAFVDISQQLLAFTDNVLPEATRSLRIFLDAASGFLTVIEDGIIKGLERMNNVLDSDSTRKFAAAWGETLPRVFEQFAAGLGHLLSGLTKFFVPILPYAERLADAFYDMMFRFNAWAGSTTGQNTIAVWMERAWNAAEALWGTLTNIVGILGSLFNIGTDEAGLGWLQSLEETTRRWNEQLKTAEGREQVSQWFADAKEVGDTLWWILKDIGSFFGELDTHQAREDLRGFLETVDTLADSLEDVAGFITTVSQAIDDFFAENEKTKDLVKTLFKVDGDSWAEIEGQLNDRINGWIDSWAGENSKTKDLVKSFFRVEGDTWNEITSEMWENFTSNLFGENQFRGQENEQTKAFIKDLFNVTGETWREITDNMMIGLLSAISDFGASHRGANPKTQQFIRDTFNVDGETWGEIVSEMWAGFTAGLGAFFQSGEGENEKTQALVRRVFNVTGETWSEIASDMWRGFTQALGTLFDSGEGENPKTKAAVKRIFSVDGDTWSEIASEMWTSFKNAIGDFFDSGEGENEKTKAMVRRIFKVDGETWSEIGQDMWDSLLQALTGYDSASEDSVLKFIVKDLFNVDGETWAEIGANMWEGFHDGVNAAFDAAGEWIRGIIQDRIITPVMEALGIASPSTVFFGIGSDTIQGLINGMTELVSSIPGLILQWVGEWSTTIQTWAQDLPGKVSTWLSDLPSQMLTNFTLAGQKIGTWLQERGTDLQTWFTSLPGKVYEWLGQLATQMLIHFNTGKAKLSVWWTETSNSLRDWFTSLPGKAYDWLSGIGEQMAKPFSGAYTKMNDALANIYAMVSRWWSSIKSVLSSVTSGAAAAGFFGIGGQLAQRWMAAGGLVSRATPAIIGEAGREAVIPLDRPLSQIDPSVRGMAATLRGGGGTTIESGAIVLQYAGQDPYRAAEAVLDGIALGLG